LQTYMRIAKSAFRFHKVCMKRDSKYVTNEVKCYNYGIL
jgi:hypothetical protein